MDKFAIGYIAIISVIAFFVTRYDKFAAKKQKRRISERNLLLLSFAGGALSMFFAMQIFRHKTKHIKFMLLLPLFVIVHIMLLYILLKWF